jgi:hypothetical protein
MQALTELFGGGKSVGMGLHFDGETYAKAKPHFINTASKFSEFIKNAAEAARRISGIAYGSTRDKYLPFAQRRTPPK